MPNYSRVIKKSKKNIKKRRVYVSTEVLNELGFLAKNLKIDTNKLTKIDKMFLEMLEELKTNEIIEDYNWGINSIDVLEIFVYPIMEGIKPMILHRCIHSFGANEYHKKGLFF